MQENPLIWLQSVANNSTKNARDISLRLLISLYNNTKAGLFSKARDLVTITPRLLDRCGVKYKLAVQQVRTSAIGGHRSNLFANPDRVRILPWRKFVFTGTHGAYANLDRFFTIVTNPATVPRCTDGLEAFLHKKRGWDPPRH